MLLLLLLKRLVQIQQTETNKKVFFFAMVVVGRNNNNNTSSVVRRVLLHVLILLVVGWIRVSCCCFVDSSFIATSSVLGLGRVPPPKLKRSERKQTIVSPRMIKVSFNMKWQTLDVNTFIKDDDHDTTTTMTRTKEHPQMYKDVPYRNAVVKAWKEENERKNWKQEDFEVEMSSIVYYTDNDQYEDFKKTKTPLYGYVIRRHRKMLSQQQKHKDDLSSSSSSSKVPGILLFHTGAGPHDIFLLWKAQSLICSTTTTSSNGGCVVLIADIISDDIGWAWDPDRSKFQSVYNSVIAMNNESNGQRVELRQRVVAAYDTLCSLEEVDKSNIAVLGWCLGGHPIFEIATSPRHMFPGIKAMITFHGVFGPVKQQFYSASEESENRSEVNEDMMVEGAGRHEETPDTSILICNGVDDPFVNSSDLDACVELFQSRGHSVEVLQLPGAKHGFTNPAQDFNDNPSFQYHEQSANIAWTNAQELLHKTLGS